MSNMLDRWTACQSSFRCPLLKSISFVTYNKFILRFKSLSILTKITAKATNNPKKSSALTNSMILYSKVSSQQFKVHRRWLKTWVQKCPREGRTGKLIQFTVTISNKSITSHIFRWKGMQQSHNPMENDMKKWKLPVNSNSNSNNNNNLNKYNIAVLSVEQ